MNLKEEILNKVMIIRRYNMSNLSELDLQNLRHLITGYETCG